MFLLALTASAVITLTSAASNVDVDQTTIYEREPYRRPSYTRATDVFIFAAECNSPPPCPVALASLPMPAPKPPEACDGAVWLAHCQGAARERRCVRDGVEKKDERDVF
jgi:hypothetical protein